ncbi:Drimenol monooxygenase-like protein [Drosera capensis]
MSKPYQFFSDLAKVYGPVISVKIGFTRMVVVSSPAMAKEVLQKSDAPFCDRSSFITMTVLGHHETTIAFSPPNAHWRDLKKICENYLFSKFNIANDFWELVAGTLDLVGISNIPDYVPLLKLVDPQGIKRRSSARYEKGTKIFREVIARRLSSKVGKVKLNKHNDMLDVILNAVHENNTEVKESELPNILLELLVGGYDTTSIVIEWAMAELQHSPSKLEKAQAELAEVVGRGKPIEEDDIDRLPYLRAIMKETFRLHPPVLFLVPRKATTDIELSGFVVPKGTQVLVNIWLIGRDESVWKDANVFQPERFMDCGIDFKGRNIELTPFGAGRRMCPGLPIAQKMLHLILGSLLNSFNWKLEEGVSAENMNMDDNYGFTLGKAERLQAIPTNIL